MSAEKRSISAPADLFAKADARKEALGYSTFSDYIQALIVADTRSGSAHVREESSPLPPLGHISARDKAILKKYLAERRASSETPEDLEALRKIKSGVPRSPGEPRNKD